MKTMKLIVALFSLVAFLLPQDKPQNIPVISPADQSKVLKYRLDDARLSNAIQQRWLAIYQTPEYQQIIQLQKTQQQNAQAYYSFSSGLCGAPASGYLFDPNTEDIKCVPKPQEKK